MENTCTYHSVCFYRHFFLGGGVGGRETENLALSRQIFSKVSFTQYCQWERLKYLLFEKYLNKKTHYASLVSRALLAITLGARNLLLCDGSKVQIFEIQARANSPTFSDVISASVYFPLNQTLACSLPAKCILRSIEINDISQRGTLLPCLENRHPLCGLNLQ